MEGIRVSNIAETVDEKDLKIYFTNSGNGGGHISQIYHPLLNNDAVIIFKDPSVIDTVVTVQHKIHRNSLVVQRLPPMVFTTIQAKLDTTVSSVLLATDSCLGALRYGEVNVLHYPKENCVILKGNWFQLEFAWEVLSKVIHSQQNIQMKIFQKKELKTSVRSADTGRESQVIHSLGRTQKRFENGYSEKPDIYDRSPMDSDASDESDYRKFISTDVRLNADAEESFGKNSYRSLVMEDSHQTSLKSVADADDYVPYSSHKYPKSQSRADDLSNSGSPSLQYNGSLSKRPTNNSYSSLQYRDSPDDRNKEITHQDKSLRSLSRSSEKGRTPKQEINSLRKDKVTGKDYDELFPKVYVTDNRSSETTRDNDYSGYNGHVERTLKKSSPSSLPGSKTYLVPSKREDQVLNGHNLSVNELLSDSESEGRIPSSKISPSRQRYRDEKHVRQLDENETFSKFSEAGKTESLLRDTDYSSVNGHSSRLRGPSEVEVFLESLRSKKGDEKPKRSSFVSESMASLGNYYEFSVGDLKVVVKCENITAVETEGLVNPANGSLSHGAGVAGAIARAASPLMEVECEEHVRKYGLLNTCDVIHTRAGGRLSSKITCILHAVGPIWIETLPERCKLELIKTYFNCFVYADKLWLKSLTVPCISSGIFGVPLEASIQCFLEGVLLFHSGHQRDLCLQEIHLVNNDADVVMTSIVLLQSLLVDGQDAATARALANFEKYSEKCEKRIRDKVGDIRKSPLGRPYQTKDDYSSSTTNRSRPGLDSSAKTSSMRRTASLDRSHPRKASDLSDSSSAKISNSRSKVSESSTSRGVTGGGMNSSSFRSKTDGDISSRKERSQSKELGNDLKSTRRRSSSASRTLSSKGTSDVNNTSGKNLSSSTRQVTGQSSTSSRASVRSSVSDQIKRSTSAKSSPPQIKQALQKATFSSSKALSKSKGSGGNLGKTMPLKAFTDEHENSDYSSSRSKLDSSRLSNMDYLYGSQSLPADFDLDNHRTRLSKQFDMCSICLDTVKNPKSLSKCNHTFCSNCIEQHFKLGKPKCPECGMLYGTVTGNQPPGTMTYTVQKSIVIPGYGHCDGAIVITYDIPPGKQKADHMNPGARYSGLQRKAFLPNNAEGREVLKLLKKAFDAKLIFTIGFSRTTGKEGVVTWNDIHHKTSIDGGPTRFGYPDSTYLKRVKEELAQFGIK